MSLYTTPLHIGYFMAWIFGLLFLWRGLREDRFSDRLMAGLMAIMALKLQDYTFGFSGVNFLWEEGLGFPRDVSLLLGPTFYLYVRALTQRDLRWPEHYGWHFVPWLVEFGLGLSLFFRGTEAIHAHLDRPEQWVEEAVWDVASWISYAYYFVRSYSRYRAYKTYLAGQQSSLDVLDPRWIGRYILGFTAVVATQEVWNVVSWFLDLDFYQDWWWNLGWVALVLWMGTQAYAQVQWNASAFESEARSSDESKALAAKGRERGLFGDDEEALHRRIVEGHYSLQSGLSIQQLADQLEVSKRVLSEAIQARGTNFNEFVNQLRLAEFKRRATDPRNRHLTLLALAFDSGFNSKATFQRTFLKSEGVSPRVWLKQQREGAVEEGQVHSLRSKNEGESA